MSGGTITWIVAGGVIVLLLLYVISIYNRLVGSRNMKDEAWSGIDVQLRRRADLVPNLVETVKGYASHEKGLLEEVTEARARSIGAKGVAAQAAAEMSMAAALGHLFAVAEAYPDLKADQNFRELQTQLAAIEEDVQSARRYYNAAARDINILIQSFPSNLVAGAFGFTLAEFFEIEDPAARAVPEVRFAGHA